MKGLLQLTPESLGQLLALESKELLISTIQTFAKTVNNGFHFVVTDKIKFQQFPKPFCNSDQLYILVVFDRKGGTIDIIDMYAFNQHTSTDEALKHCQQLYPMVNLN